MTEGVLEVVFWSKLVGFDWRLRLSGIPSGRLREPESGHL